MLFPPINPGLDRWTLAEVAERGELVLECVKCSHVAMMDVPKFITEFGGEALVRDVLRQSICRKCGRKRARALIRLRGVRGDKAWWPTSRRAGR
jgi:hypothetical protein